MYGWCDLNPFSWAESDKNVLPVIRWSVSSFKAFPVGTCISSPSISLGPNGRGL